jgi:hypothetical protein
MVRPLIVAASLVVAGFAIAPSSAEADSFVFGYSSGDYRRGHHGHRSYHHGHHRHYAPPRYHSHYRYDYYRPPVIYVPPPVVYAPPVYAAPPVISAAPASPVYVAPNGQYCREYQGGMTVGGYPQRGYGTACLMPDGSWRVVN